MKGRENRALKKKGYSALKRLFALVLTAAMILTNIGTNINTVYAAGSSESITFSMRGSQLVDAVEEAIASGNVVTEDTFDFTNGKIEEFEDLFFGGEGKIYEAFPDTEGVSMDAELRVFARIPEDADNLYMVTGDEEIIFLYVNNGEDTIRCSAEITRMDGDVERVKRTKRVTVKSYEAAFGDEKINIISKQMEETKTPEETKGPAAGSNTTPAQSEAQTETTAPAQGGSVTEEISQTAEAPDESPALPAEEETKAEEETQESATAASSESETEESGTVADEDGLTEEPATENSDESPTEEAENEVMEEIEETETEGSQEPVEPMASIMPHYAPVVAVNEAAAAEDKTDVETEKETEADAETEAEKEKETQEETEAEKETEAQKETQAPEKETAASEAAETTAEAETTAAAETTAEAKTTAAVETHESEAGQESGASTAESTAALPSESETKAVESQTAASSKPVKQPEKATSSEAQNTPAPQEPEKKVSKAGNTDLVGMGYCSTAKVYKTTINDLKALEDFEGYKVTYTFNPQAGGHVVEGARGVKEGEDLSFGIKENVGFSMESVSANGEMRR